MIGIEVSEISEFRDISEIMESFQLENGMFRFIYHNRKNSHKQDRHNYHFQLYHSVCNLGQVILGL